jgi:hypothetical protein
VDTLLQEVNRQAYIQNLQVGTFSRSPTALNWACILEVPFYDVGFVNSGIQRAGLAAGLEFIARPPRNRS